MRQDFRAADDMVRSGYDAMTGNLWAAEEDMQAASYRDAAARHERDADRDLVNGNLLGFIVNEVESSWDRSEARRHEHQARRDRW